MAKPIPGRWYLVKVDGSQAKVQAIEPSLSGLWWVCKSPHGAEVVVPVSAFKSECNEDGQDQS